MTLFFGLFTLQKLTVLFELKFVNMFPEGKPRVV